MSEPENPTWAGQITKVLETHSESIALLGKIARELNARLQALGRERAKVGHDDQ